MPTHFCTACKKNLDVSLFHKDKDGKNGLKQQCIACRKKIMEDYYKAHPDKLKAKNDRISNWGKANRDKRRIHQQVYRDTNPKYKEDNWKNYLKNEYGITAEKYNEMIIECGNRCCICRREFNTLTKRPDIDHDHATGKVRGLLCHHCNSGPGSFHDNTDYLTEAIKYLNHHSEAIHE